MRIMNYKREALVQSEATMNQLRNAVYILERFMKLNEITDIKKRLRRMGKKIAQTYSNYWKPIDFVDVTNIKDVLATLYKSILNSGVSIELDNLENSIIVKDSDCALCKYHFEDINEAGCEIILAMMAEFVNLINNESKNTPKLSLQPHEIIESRSLGHKSCIHHYKYKIGGN
jgi:hypothetical protein